MAAVWATLGPAYLDRLRAQQTAIDDLNSRCGEHARWTRGSTTAPPGRWAGSKASSSGGCSRRSATTSRPSAPIDLEWARLEMRKTGVTLQLVWAEYCAAVKAGGGSKRPYQYSQFCELYRRFEAKVDVVMRQDHRAGAFAGRGRARPGGGPARGTAAAAPLTAWSGDASEGAYPAQ